MFSYPVFDVVIERTVEARSLYWPAPGEAGHDSAVGGNRHYEDMRGFTWTEARRVHELEQQLIGRIVAADDPDEEYEAIDEELYEDPEGLIGLDIGVASSVVALSAARCLPFSSCNGGAFGGNHYESHPVVAFCAKAELVPLLLDCAEIADVGLITDTHGQVILYARDIRAMPAFARAVMDRSSAFREIRLSPLRHRSELGSPKDQQLKMFK